MRSRGSAGVLLMLLGCAACGSEGQRWHQAVQQDGHLVEFETWYHPPGLERVIGNDGISYRIAVDGNTMQRVGNYYPPEWLEHEANAMDYSQAFWGEVITKFEALPVPKERREEVAWLKTGLVDLRDVPRTLPTDHVAANALRMEQEDPDYAAELARSQAMGRKMMEDYRRDHPEEFEGELPEGAWGWGGRNKNRGFRAQVREPGQEYHQVIEVHSEHFFGLGYDHSGTKVWTYKRRQGSDEPWALVTAGTRACNHGACPDTESMKLRWRCDSGVVSDWYVVDGECEGNWMTGHLCNDDTSLQINHAQGVWTGWTCPGHNRGIAPRCGRQFK